MTSNTVTDLEIIDTQLKSIEHAIDLIRDILSRIRGREQR